MLRKYRPQLKKCLKLLTSINTDELTAENKTVVQDLINALELLVYHTNDVLDLVAIETNAFKSISMNFSPFNALKSVIGLLKTEQRETGV